MEPSRKRVRSDMWGYFKLIAPDKVQCSLCSAELKYHSNTSSMIRHFTSQHGAVIKQVKTNEVDQKPDLDETLVNMLVEHSEPFPKVASLLLSKSTEQPRKKGRSDMWDYFKLITPDKVRCSLCSAELKYQGSTSSMIRHFTSLHGAVVKQVKTNEVDQKPDLDETLVNMLVEHSEPFPKVASLLLSKSTEQPRKKGRSDMWDYFKLITPDKVRCSVCSAELKYQGSTSSMIRHFTSLHGAVVKQVKTNEVDQKPDLDETLVNMLVEHSEPFPKVASLLLSKSTEQPRKKGRSDMWDYFKLITPDKVRCSLCSAELKYQGSTSSMIRHFTSLHGGAVKGKTSQDDRKQMLDEALVNMLVMDSQPFSIVDDCGFKEFVALLDPAYTLPSKNALKDMVIQRYKNQKAKAQAQAGDSDPDC